jgi:V8-like Glu-specific endopeptidase
MRPVDTPLFLDRLAEQADYAVIGPVDGRRRVVDTRRAPYQAVCHLDRSFAAGRSSGCTGFLVAPRLVLTAGHCVYSPLRRVLGARPSPRSIRVAPGRADATEAPYGTMPAVRWWAHTQYLRTGARPFDVGLIELGDAPQGVAPLGLHAPGDDELSALRQTRLLHVSGYPADKPRGTQWQHEERLDRTTPRDLFYSIDTCPGHSGAPVWVERWPGRSHSVVGVHTAGPRPHARGAWGCRPGVPMAPRGNLNRGVRLTNGLRDAVLQIGDGGTSPLFVALTSTVSRGARNCRRKVGGGNI